MIIFSLGSASLLESQHRYQPQVTKASQVLQPVQDLLWSFMPTTNASARANSSETLQPTLLLRSRLSGWWLVSRIGHVREGAVSLALSVDCAERAVPVEFKRIETLTIGPLSGKNLSSLDFSGDCRTFKASKSWMKVRMQCKYSYSKKYSCRLK